MTHARTLLIDLAVLAGVGFALALLGPFGSFDAPFPRRLAYWVSLTIGGYAVYRPALGAAEWLASRLDLPRAAAWIAACLIATVPMSFLVWAVEGFYQPLGIPSFDEAATYYGNVLVVAAVLCLIFWFLGENAERQRAMPQLLRAPAVAVEAAPPPPRFLDRLPATAGRDLIALEMQDHYVLAHTATGQALLLMRMRDAVAELDGYEGAQVHRSWWVARKAVREVKRDGRNVRLVLTRGLEVPVARAAIATLQQSGWLSR